MAHSKKDGRAGGAHKPWHSSRLMTNSNCGVHGKPTGVKEPLRPKTKRYFKRLTSKSRRRKSKEILDAELFAETGSSSPRRGGQWKGKVKIADDFNEMPDEFFDFFR